MAEWCAAGAILTMTARANVLTDRATLPAHALGVFVDCLRVLGYDTAPLLGAAGLSAEDLSDPDGQVPCESYGTILGRAQQQRFTSNLALALAQVTPLGAWPLLDYLVVTADTVGDGIRQLARYFRVVGDPVFITVRDAADPIRVELSGSAPFAVEYNAALMVRHLRAETEGRFSAAGISLQHTIDDPAAFARAAGCPVAHNAPWSGISVSLAAWQLPMRRRDPILRAVLEGHADGILARLPERRGLALDVQRLLAQRIAGGDTRIESVGRALAMSARTLQRRLAVEGISYQRLLEDARKEAAGRYLTESTLAIGEIAYLIGYSEPAPFHRAFKRWYNRTPEAYRRMRA
jgi:AraC-like DNA-binding protein